MTFSACIPCAAHHWRLLPKCLKSIEGQSSAPDEILVLLNGLKLSESEIAAFSRKHPKVRLRVVEQPMFAGPARQLAAMNAFGDWIIYGDADDLWHPNRVECIRHFAKEGWLTINHAWAPIVKYPGTPVKPQDIKRETSSLVYHQYWPDLRIGSVVNATKAFGSGFGIRFHAGAVSLQRHLLIDTPWRAPDDLMVATFNRAKGEDYELLSEIWFKYNKSAVLLHPLYFYKT